MMTDRIKRWILIGAVLLSALLSLACIKIGERDPVVTPVPPTPTPVPPTPTPIPPTPMPVPDAGPEILDVRLCRGFTDDERPFAETNTYSTLDPFMVSIRVNHFQPQNIVAAHWYHQEAIIGLTERDNVTGGGYVGLALEPQTQWLPGDYEVEISLDGEVRETRTFAVIGMAGLPDPSNPQVDPEPVEDVTWRLYREDNLGFSVEYPDGWLIEEGGSAVQFTHPNDIALALVLVDTDPAADAEQEAEAVLDSLTENLSNLEVSDSSPQDDDWHAMFFSYDDQGTLVDGVLLSKVVAERGYNLVLIVVDEQWDAMVPTLEQIWDSFTIGGASGVPAGGEIMVEGLIRDADTGRGIPDGLFVILQEGVTVDRFVESGNDESLIYDMAHSGPDGTFSMNLPLEQGASYEVFALADGYAPVVDVLEVPAQASDPWPITVTMQKE